MGTSPGLPTHKRLVIGHTPHSWPNNLWLLFGIVRRAKLWVDYVSPLRTDQGPPLLTHTATPLISDIQETIPPNNQ